MKTNLRIDIISDVVCPWCVIGYKRLEKALDMLRDKILHDIHWHPFELNPNMAQGGENLRQHLAAKYGTTLQGSIKARENLTRIGAEVGFKFDYFDEMKMFNTFKAHQLIHYAGTKNKKHEMELRLFAAFFGERKEIDHIDVLAIEAEVIGLDKNEAVEVLQNGRFADQVRQEEREWLNRGIQSVPTYIINQRQMFSGAHEPETITRIIKDLSGLGK